MKLPSSKSVSSLLALTVFGLTATSSLAVTMHWGNAILGNVVKSDGTAIDTADNFEFELGVFDPSFIPTEANVANWIDNWIRIDSADYNEAASYFTSSFEFIPDPAASPGSATFSISNSPEASSGAEFTGGTAIYLLVYNNTLMNTTTEIFLGRANTWEVPNPADNQTTLPLNNRLSQITGTPIYGGANNNSGAGERSVVPATFNLQTATFVPEPSGILLFLLGTGLACARRQRKN
jgi:hypothetical protein